MIENILKGYKGHRDRYRDCLNLSSLAREAKFLKFFLGRGGEGGWGVVGGECPQPPQIFMIH